MDRISDIEAQLREVLLGINGTQVNAYQYLTEVKTVDLEDEVLNIDGGGYPSILITMDPDETIISGESKAYRNEIRYTLTCRVENLTIDISPKQAIKIEMNKMLQDVKFALSNNYHLNDTCDVVKMIRSRRKYHDENSILRTGDLVINISITYTQSRLNPSINVCT